MLGVSVIVRNESGRLVTDLTRDHFRLLVDGRPVPIDVFSNDPAPLAIALMVNSNNWEAVGRFRSVAQAVVDALVPPDRAAIGTFSNEIAISPLTTSDIGILHRVLLEEIWPGWSNPLSTAVHKAIIGLTQERAKKAVIVIGSDSAEQCLHDFPCIGVDNAIRKARDEDVSVYGVTVDLKESAPTNRPVRRLAYETGGGYVRLPGSLGDLSSNMSKVLEELRREYVLGFGPPVRDNKAHRISVRITLPDHVAHTRRAYRLEGY